MPATTPHGVTVCIPSHTGRGALVADLLATLAVAREAAPGPVEVLVVDDAAGEEAARLVGRCSEYDARYLRGPASAGGKRNLGARAARHDALLFVDSDCLATPELVAEHLRCLRAAPPDVAGVAGRTEMHGSMSRAWRALEHSRLHNVCFDFTSLYSEVEWAVTCNLSVRRDVLLEVGGFCEEPFTRFGGEDVDLGARVTAAGYRWITSPDAVVLHRREPIRTLRDAARKLFTYGRADVFLTLRHPARRVRHGATAGVYGPRLEVGRERRTGAAGVARRVQAALVDAAFYVGIAWEAVRRGHPKLALYHFDYASTRHCVARGKP